MWCSVFARFCHLCWQAGAHGWNVNESWPGTWWFPVSSTQHAFGCGVGKIRGTAAGSGSMAHCWALKQQAPFTGRCRHYGVGGIGVGFVCFGSRVWPMPHMSAPFCWGVCGGGCDGVVVWELHSGREHLARTTRDWFACPLGWVAFLCVVFAKAII